MRRVEFAPAASSPSESTNYHLNIEIDSAERLTGDHVTQKPPPSSGGLRRANTFNVATEEEQRNIISLRYRADSMADSVEMENTSNTEARVWHTLEQIFCFLKGVTIYQTRRRLKFIIVTQAVINTLRIFPIILGLSYQATLPVLILYITLILGWHGSKFLVPKFLLSYKIGMQLSLLVDIIWYSLGYNGRLNSVSSGTSVLMQGFLSIILSLLNLAGLLYGWKLRRIVKAVQNQREYDRAALATMMPATSPPRASSMHQLRQTMSITRLAEVDDTSARRSITVGRGEHNTIGKRRKSMAPNRTAAPASADGKDGAPPPPPTFCSNSLRTSKYTLYNFPFVFFKLQFSRLANIYTTIVVMLCFFSFSPVSPVASLTPLLIVFATSALKDVSEDLRRQKADRHVNSKPAHIVRRDVNDQIQHIEGMWQDIQVGDLLILKDGDEVPADCVLLATSRPDGRCYVETANLDGETNLKIRSVTKCTKKFLLAEDILDKHRLFVECDAPNKDLFYFDGVLKLLPHDEPGVVQPQVPATAANGDTSETDTSLTMDNMILRGCESRNSEWTIGLVVYTGRETKISMNSAGVPLKRSFVEKTLDTMFLLVLILLFGISVACTLGNNDWGFLLNDGQAPWYISNVGDNGYIFLSYVILFNNLIPLSMYVTMEGVRFVHARYIENDLEMYDEGTDTPAQVRNSNINEDLGQIQYIFSDKTGTLTRNEMVFSKCTIGGLRYNDVETDLDRAPRPGTRFNDSRLIGRLNANHSTKNEIHNFLLLLTICNTVIPEYESSATATEDGAPLPPVKYNASSPDEQALVLAARDLGYVLMSRDGPICHTMLQGKMESFEILNVLEFNSDRKRMSVIFRHPDGSIYLFCKGADDVLFDLLSTTQPQGVAHVTRGHLQEYASEGLRTLTTAMRKLSQEEYDQWHRLYREAEMSMNNRAEKIARVSAVIEVELTLLGATAIEDRLQEGVEECIMSLRKAGIKFWVLTGDKKETALSIGMSSHVIDDNMDVIVLGQRDKASLRAKLEELYVDLVDDKWGADETSSYATVLYEAFKRGLSLGWTLLKTATVGRDEQAETRKKRRRVPRHNERANGGVETTPVDARSDFNEVYPINDNVSEMSFDRGLCDKNFEPKNSPSGYVEEYDDELEFAMVIDGKTLALVLDDDIKYLFLAVATQCKSVICCRCSPSQKASVVKLVTEPTLMFSPGNITLAIGDGANDVPMIQAANVGIGISGKEGRQAVLSSDYALAQFRFLKRLVLVHGNYSYKRISKLILFSFMKNVALSLSNFFLAVQTLYSGLLMYFGIYFTLYNALFTTIPIVFIAMYNQDVSPAVLMQYPTLYMNGLKNRSFNWMSFFGWCGLGIWHAYVIYAVPFFSDGFITWYFAKDSNDTYLFGGNDRGLWADGVAAYTYLITASTAQVALMTSNWTKANVYSTVGTLIFYYLFTAFFCQIYGWTKAEVYETESAYGVLAVLLNEPWFWFGLLLATIGAVLPNYIAKAGRVLFYPEPSHLMREWNRLAQSEEAPAAVESPRLVRHNTGFAFSHYPGEGEMALSQYRRSFVRPSLGANGYSGLGTQSSSSPASTAEESTPSRFTPQSATTAATV
ncbi:hypothetical protein Poli38472_006157 [Pythium oligandrum]|uniref:Phospholipid-transporting ATPase n=1 Tax=Pythium oligandrum TaxID=41045 RepID=A0A8K1CT01_PYTOL|nr:hypothetical protein Poli38472_006157 [Pythium oligandrum]|eukprot:TMW68689.1 hypothetical protein Poli38472_006157 [Pythium oligandrum]